MSAAPPVPLPLEGVRVLDLTNVLAGPFCTYQLALMGAEVVKVEQPVRGDLARRLGADPEAAKRGMGASFVAVNAGKQSVTLDLKHPEGKEVLKRLVAEADALVENFRPGVMDRLALGYDTLSGSSRRWCTAPSPASGARVPSRNAPPTTRSSRAPPA